MISEAQNAEGTQLRKLQLTQLEILKLIDRFCREKGIPYSLYAGTLLGAVRHQGFIPWDDDLDICMSRKDYNRFLQLWEEEKPAGYILQNKENSPGFSPSFSKIRKDHTCFLQFESEIGHYQMGIFVDIFPIDRMPNGRVTSKLFQLKCLEYQLLTREFLPTDGNPAVKAIAKLILKLSSPEQRAAKRKRLLHWIEKYNDNKELPAVAIETQSTIRTPLPSNFMAEFTELTFEDSEFMCTAVWDEYLSAKYGDYMKLPPESQRVWKHHPLILDFDRNYEELTEEEKLQRLKSVE